MMTPFCLLGMGACQVMLMELHSPVTIMGEIGAPVGTVERVDRV